MGVVREPRAEVLIVYGPLDPSPVRPASWGAAGAASIQARGGPAVSLSAATRAASSWSGSCISDRRRSRSRDLPCPLGISLTEIRAKRRQGPREAARDRAGRDPQLDRRSSGSSGRGRRSDRGSPAGGSGRRLSASLTASASSTARNGSSNACSSIASPAGELVAHAGAASRAPRCESPARSRRGPRAALGSCRGGRRGA